MVHASCFKIHLSFKRRPNLFKGEKSTKLNKIWLVGEDPSHPENPQPPRYPPNKLIFFESTIQNWNVMLIDEVKTSQSNIFLSTMMKRNCLFISFYTPKKCMEEHYEHTLVLKTKLWYLENEMITEQGYISSKDIRRAPGEVWKVAFPKVKINIREQTSPRASFPQKVKVLKTETIFSQIRNVITFWIRVVLACLILCYWLLYWNSLIWNVLDRGSTSAVGWFAFDLECIKSVCQIIPY